MFAKNILFGPSITLVGIIVIPKILYNIKISKIPKSLKISKFSSGTSLVPSTFVYLSYSVGLLILKALILKLFKNKKIYLCHK